MTDTTTSPEVEAQERGEENGKGWLQNIREMMDAYKAAQKREGSYFGDDDDDDEDEDQDTDADEDDDAEDYSGSTSDDIRERIEESPLSVQVRDGWKNPGAESEGPEEFEILLSTGGPALRIIGELDEHLTPYRVQLQHQDWGTPWTDIRLTADDRKIVQAYCEVFYFGEG